MLRRILIAAAFAATAVPAFAQESGVIQRWPGREEQSAPAPPPQSAPQPAPPPQRTAEPRRQPAPPPSAPQQAAPPERAERTAEQRRQPNDRDRDGERVAVPRTRPVPRDVGRPGPDRRRDTVIIAPRVRPYYYYSRPAYPYGYGAFGLGYFYYDPYSWYPRGPLNYYGGPSGYWGYGYGYDFGELRLRVTPRDAQVFVDGYFAGTVDDYDGALQGLRLESGPYHIELRLPGYESVEFDVRVIPGQKVTYRGDLRRLP